VNKRVFVSGGSDFLGSHLCECLLRQGQEALYIDSFETGAVNNIRQLTGERCFRYIHHDVRPIVTNLDEIYSLACPASTIHYQADRVRTLTTIVHGAHNMVQLGRQLDAKILHGGPAAHPQRKIYGVMSKQWSHARAMTKQALRGDLVFRLPMALCR
jgi:UDP-glucuronate decarboxylase